MKRVLLGILAIILVVLLTLWFAHRQSLRIVAQWKQPSGLSYGVNSPYFLSVYETDLDWRGFPLYMVRHYAIYAGLDEGEPTYGHTIDFTFYPDHQEGMDVLPAIKKTKVVWSENGVTLKMVSGHQVFIPKDMFIGGR
jgi:hypothetical protein